MQRVRKTFPHTDIVRHSSREVRVNAKNRDKQKNVSFFGFIFFLRTSRLVPNGPGYPLTLSERMPKKLSETVSRSHARDAYVQLIGGDFEENPMFNRRVYSCHSVLY